MEKRHSKKKGMHRPEKKQLQNMLDTLRGTADDSGPARLSDMHMMSGESGIYALGWGGGRSDHTRMIPLDITC